MVANKLLPEAGILAPKQKIFSKLCADSLRFKTSDRVDAKELRRELNIPEKNFREALFGFLSAEKQMAVEVLEGKGPHILGETGRDICSDWNGKKTSDLRKIEASVDIPMIPTCFQLTSRLGPAPVLACKLELSVH